ncbi:AT-rich interactive domain-containing protein 1A-like isoform X1, partial [Clarias magur]
MAAQVAALSTSPAAELKKADAHEDALPGETTQHESAETGGKKELQDGVDAPGGGERRGGGGDPEMKNGNDNSSRNNNNNNNLDAGVAPPHHHNQQQHPGAFPPPPYGGSQHYTRGPFHQHGGQQSSGMVPGLPGGVMEQYPGNSHEYGFSNHYGPFPNRTQYQGQGYGMNSPRANQPGKPGPTLMAFNNQ